MKKLLSAVCFALFAVVLSTAAFADIAQPPIVYKTRGFLEEAIVPIVIALVIFAIGVLIMVLKSKKK